MTEREPGSDATTEHVPDATALLPDGEADAVTLSASSVPHVTDTVALSDPFPAVPDKKRL